MSGERNMEQNNNQGLSQKSGRGEERLLFKKGASIK
jgi:hypothetical protein